MQIPILTGIYTDSNADVRTSYPVNMMPLPGNTGISNSYLRPSLGVITLTTGTGKDRGAINWNGVCYRVSGTSLISVAEDGTTDTIGTISGTGLARMNYSFDYLSINADNKLWFYDGTTLTQNVDADLGDCVDHIFDSGYFLSTDGEYVVNTELADPTSVSANKYASSEFDPDPILAILKPRNNPLILNRYSIEEFYQIGGSGFPYAVNRNAVITRGTVGTRTCCVLGDAVFFMGSGRDESISVFVAAAGQSRKIATREIDFILARYTETELSQALMETRIDETETVYIHLPDVTLVYDKDISVMIQQPAWYFLSNGLEQESISGRTFEAYRKYNARNMVKCYDKWIVGDPDTTNIGYLTRSVQTLYGEHIRWAFSTYMLYSGGRNGIVHQLELVGIPGRQAQGSSPIIYTRYTTDGENYSQRKRVRLGAAGNRTKRMVWVSQGMIRNYRIQEFSGISDAMASYLRLEANIEALNA
jgi:hypothetical protein